MTLERTATPYCQSCTKVMDRDKLKLVLVETKPFWLCPRCIDPIPRKGYRVDSKNQNKAYKPHLHRVNKRGRA